MLSLLGLALFALCVLLAQEYRGAFVKRRDSGTWMPAGCSLSLDLYSTFGYRNGSWILDCPTTRKDGY